MSTSAVQYPSEFSYILYNHIIETFQPLERNHSQLLSNATILQAEMDTLTNDYRDLMSQRISSKFKYSTVHQDQQRITKQYDKLKQSFNTYSLFESSFERKFQLITQYDLLISHAPHLCEETVIKKLFESTKSITQYVLTKLAKLSLKMVHINETLKSGLHKLKSAYEGSFGVNDTSFIGVSNLLLNKLPQHNHQGASSSTSSSTESSQEITAATPSEPNGELLSENQYPDIAYCLHIRIQKQLQSYNKAPSIELYQYLQKAIPEGITLLQSYQRLIQPLQTIQDSPFQQKLSAINTIAQNAITTFTTCLGQLQSPEGLQTRTFPPITPLTPVISDLYSAEESPTTPIQTANPPSPTETSKATPSLTELQQSQIQEYQLLSMHLRQNLQELQAQNTVLQLRNTELEQCNTEIAERTMRIQAAASREEIEELQRKIQELEAENRTLLMSNSEKDETIEQLTIEKTQLEEQLKALRDKPILPSNGSTSANNNKKSGKKK
ncbi:MAG: hypothetical protein P4L16_03925 [Chlamydiales bacterium]|nr:hypothetical protein [Chlamydiales bacterium]